MCNHGGILILFSALCLLPSTLLSIPSTEFRVQFGVVNGSYIPDLEDKFAADRSGGAAVAGGAGFQGPWENKTAGGSKFLIEYLQNEWLFQLESTSITGKPEYTAYTQLPSGSLTITLFESVQLAPLYRGTNRLTVGFDLYRDRQNEKLYLFGGLRTFDQEAEYNRILFNQYTTNTASASESGLSADDTTSAYGTGSMFGLDYRYTYSDSIEIQSRFHVSLLSGRWEMQRLIVMSGGSLDLRSEHGLLGIVNYGWLIGLNWYGTEQWIFNLHVQGETSHIQDSSVSVIAGNTSSSRSTEQLLLDIALTYPGSVHTEKLFTMTFGATYRFNL